MSIQNQEITVKNAIAQSVTSVEVLQSLAQRHRHQHSAINDVQTIRHWQTDARCYCYQTHIAISGQSREQLTALANTLFHANAMEQQPWYPQFLGGDTRPITEKPPDGIHAQQLALGKFDLGLPSPRCYRQLVSLAFPVADSAVIVARSVDTGPELPIATPLAYTLAPNGEVLHWQDDCLHWHHICCTPGAGILPGRTDRWLMNTLRWLQLDSAERKTYHNEAVTMQQWLQGQT